MTVLLIRRMDIEYDHNPTTRDALVGVCELHIGSLKLPRRTAQAQQSGNSENGSSVRSG